jgi:hypothetical protein
MYGAIVFSFKMGKAATMSRLSGLINVQAIRQMDRE